MYDQKSVSLYTAFFIAVRASTVDVSTRAHPAPRQGHAAACAKERQKRFTRGNMALSTLLNAQLQANDAELKYLTLLQRCSHPEVMEAVSKKMPPFDPGKQLDAKLLRELFEAELKAK